MATVSSPILTDATFATKMDALAAAVKPDASDIPLTPPSGMTATNVQDGFSEIKQSLSDLTLLEKTASGAIVTFDDGSDLPMPSLKVSIEPVQSGSGEPSPTNVRPISGWDEVNVTMTGKNPQDIEQTYTIDLDGTRYGGELDVTSGVLTVDRAYVDLGSLTWTYRSTQNVFSTEISGLKRDILICSNYKYTDVNNVERMNDGEIWDKGNAFSPTNVIVKDLRYTDALAFTTAMNGVQLVYNLATPLTIQLTPTQVKSLLGVNNIWANTGELELTYFVNNSLVYCIYDMINILTS